MQKLTRLVLPAEVASELSDSGLALLTPPTRGPSATEVVRVTVDLVNTGGALVSLALGLNAIKGVAGAILKRRRGDDGPLTVSVTRKGRSKSVTLDSTDPDAEALLRDFLLSELSGDDGNTSQPPSSDA